MSQDLKEAREGARRLPGAAGFRQREEAVPDVQEPSWRCLGVSKWRCQVGSEVSKSGLGGKRNGLGRGLVGRHQ